MIDGIVSKHTGKHGGKTLNECCPQSMVVDTCVLKQEIIVIILQPEKFVRKVWRRAPSEFSDWLSSSCEIH